MTCLAPVAPPVAVPSADPAPAVIAVAEALQPDLAQGFQIDKLRFNGFDLSWQDGPKGSVLWIRDDESGNVEAVTAFILRLAEELNLSGLWGFEHSNTCSRPRLDAFGGGAHLIDLRERKVIGWVNTHTWLAQVLNGQDPDA